MKKLIRAIWENKHLIVQGLVSRLFNFNKKLAQRRMNICNVCAFNSANTKDRPHGLLPYKHCTECGCSLAIKTHSKDSECPIGKW